MKKLILIGLCVLFVVGTTAFGTTWSYTISGKVKAEGIGGVNAAAVAHYVTWSNSTTTGGGVGPTLADGSFSASMSQYTETYINRPMLLLASKGQMSGSKSWTCAASSEVKNVDIYFNVDVNPNLGYAGEPVHFSGATMIGRSTQVAFVQPGYTGETQLQGYDMTLSYDESVLSLPSVTQILGQIPLVEFATFDVDVSVPGTIVIHAEWPLEPVELDNVTYIPTPLYQIDWTATDTGTQYITTVQTEMVQMNLGWPPGDPCEAVPHATEHLVGDAEKCQATFRLDSAEEWQDALDSEWPQESLRPMLESEWEKHMALWSDPDSDKEGKPYIPDCNFEPAELWVYDGNDDSNDPLDPCDGGLVMYWGEPNSSTVPDGNYATAWTYDFGLDPDLRNKIIKVTVTPPQFGNGQINAVSFGITDIAGLKRWWWWSCGNLASGAPIIWNQQNTVTIDTSLTGLAAATPMATGYVSAAGFNLAQAQSFDVDENFQWIFGPGSIPPPGQPLFMGMWNYWHWLLITNKTPPVAVTSKYHVKWSQRPDVIDDAGSKYILGWDEVSDYNNSPIVADDWLCEDDRPVTDVHWWGSFKGWTQPYLPPVVPKVFHIGIWTDDPCSGPGDFSHPNDLIWENYCDNWVWNFFGYDIDPKEEIDNEACFQFNQLLSEDEWFKQDPCEPWPWGENPPDKFPSGRVYWLSISAIYDPDQQVLYPWGWKTRQPEWNDDAVLTWAINDPTGQPWPPTGPTVGCVWASGSPIEVPLEPGGDPISWDVAFELTTNKPSPDKPESADLNWDGIVNFKDLAILANQWLMAGP